VSTQMVETLRRTNPDDEPETKPFPLAVNARTAARMMGLSVASWYRHCSAGRTPKPVKIGKSSRWRVDELRAWIEAGCPNLSEFIKN
jgi:predicted DNA-binding transcriptional regulator AlpA